MRATEHAAPSDGDLCGGQVDIFKATATFIVTLAPLVAYPLVPASADSTIAAWVTVSRPAAIPGEVGILQFRSSAPDMTVNGVTLRYVPMDPTAAPLDGPGIGEAPGLTNANDPSSPSVFSTTPAGRELASHQSPAATPDGYYGTGSRQNWTGYTGYEVNGNWYGLSELGWIVPAVQAPTTYQRTAGIWPGLGDCSSIFETLIQAGTTSASDSSGAHYSAWYQMCPEDHSYPIPVAVSPGDSVFSQVQYTPLTGGLKGTFYFANYSTGVYASFTDTYYNNGTSGGYAQSMLERSSACQTCSLYYLSWFGHASITLVHWRQSGQTLCIGSWPNDRWDMYDQPNGAGNLLAYSRWNDGSGCTYTATRTSVD